MVAAAFSTHGPFIESRRVLTAALVIGSVVLLVFGLEPLLLGSIVDRGLLDQRSVGALLTVEIFSVALGAAVGPRLMNRRLRAKLVTASILLAIVNLSTLAATGAGQIFALRLAAGLLEGLLLACVNLIAAHSRRPELMSGLLLGLGCLPQILFAYLIPVALDPMFGRLSVFLVLAASALVAALCAPLLVDRVQVADGDGDGSGKGGRWPAGLILFGVAVFIQNCGMGGLWGYAERLGVARGLDANQIASAFAASLFGQVVAGLAGAWLARRVAAFPLLVVGGILQIAVVCVLGISSSVLVFSVAITLFSLFWPSLQPGQLGVFIRAEPTRRAAVMMSPIVLLGNGAGPLMLSAGVGSGTGGVVGGVWLAAGLVVAGLITTIIALHMLSRPGPATIPLFRVGELPG
ncbi:MAG: hypothetical protein DI569_11760 [Sphingopyxis macrogoltabida]|uniref:MFS transporter n=1 Tax=Sphingopyxis macrogoltabida TaxID=33050 RepID=A0A2W5KWW9_SPHMC|nr:MAG: hypothetical protein DI569_11760 [Sphingopyxis macrogoltabida]